MEPNGSHYPPPSSDYTTPGFSNSLPSQLVPVPHSTALELRRLYRTQLWDSETVWRDRYWFFLQHGLELRFRYKPGWTASWLDMDIDPAYCDDSIEQGLSMVLDAKRQKDNAVVCIKRIVKRTEEVDIGRYLSTEEMLQDPKNHCVPIWDYFRDPVLPEVEYIVMPTLRQYNSPEFCAVGEVVDFVTQILEGMNFMHDHLVAHGDLTTPNIMMDARPILPHGWHFVTDIFLPNGVDLISPLARIDHPVRYFIIDYDCSMRLYPGQPQLVQGFGGRDGDAPELATSKSKPYDPFKLDVFTVGNVFYKDFYQKYDGLDFLKPLINMMKTPDFRQRPTAYIVLQHWYSIRNLLDVGMARWRLQKKDETVGERVILDTVAAARQSIHNVKRLFNHGEEKKPRKTP